MIPIGATVNDAMTIVARDLAQRNGLIRADGSIACWNCKRANALMPSLHCAQCLQRHRDWNAGGDAHTVNVAQQTTPAAPKEPPPRNWHDTEKDPAEDWDRGQQ